MERAFALLAAGHGSVQPHTRGFCDPCCTLLIEQREEWLKASMGSCYDELWWQFPNVAAEMVRKAGCRR